MTDITDASRFHVRIVSDNQYPRIEQELAKFDSIKA
jgi:staphylococcal nuclease domain-containing protein 1